VLSDNCLSKYITIVWFETGLLSLSLILNFGISGMSGFKLSLKPKLKCHFMFWFNLGFKPVLGFKSRF